MQTYLYIFLSRNVQCIYQYTKVTLKQKKKKRKKNQKGKVQRHNMVQKKKLGPGGVAQLGGVSSHTPKCFGFDSPPEHITRS